MGVGGSNALTGEKCNIHHFNLDTAAYQMDLGTGSIVIDKLELPKEWFTITVDYSWGHTCLESVKKMLSKRGGKVVGNVFVPVRAQDFSTALVKAVVSDAPVLCVIVYGSGQGKLLQQIYDLKVHTKMQIVVIASDLTIALNINPTAIEGVLVGLPWYWNLNNNTTKI
jgi:branched-chain amino acid transport system substrate-binding protein